MKKLALLMAVLMVAGAAPGWCLVAEVDAMVDNHTKNSSFRPVQDTGAMYGVMSKGVDTSVARIPGATKTTRTIADPIRHVAKETIRGSKLLLNGTWDLLTLRHFREKKTE